MSEQSELTQLLQAARDGDDDAREKLLPYLYRDIHAPAHRELVRNRGGQRTLCTTALAHEVFLRLASQQNLGFRDRAHFLAYYAWVMRTILIDQARSRQANKGGGGFTRVQWDEERAGGGATPEQVLALDEALTRLQDAEPRLAPITELRVFGGLKFVECASVLDVSERTAHRSWRQARAMLGAILDYEPGC